MTDTTEVEQRRVYGTGSLHWEPTRGRWVAVVQLPPALDGKRRRKAWTSRTREVVEAKLAAHLEEHPPREYLGRAGNLARARLLGTHTDSDWWALVRSVKKRCHYCGIVTDVYGPALDPDHISRDHRTPLSRGGSDSIDNIVVSCRRCNEEKKSMTEPEYLTWKATR